MILAVWFLTMLAFHIFCSALLPFHQAPIEMSILLIGDQALSSSASSREHLYKNLKLSAVRTMVFWFIGLVLT